MSFDIQLSRKDKSSIKKEQLEKVLWQQHWICRLPEPNSYALIHMKDQCYIEITHEPQEFDTAFSKPEEIDLIELRSWAGSSELTINHLIRLIDTLSTKLVLEIYDPQQGKKVLPPDYDSIEDSYTDWRQSVHAISLKLEGLEDKKLLPVTVFVGHSFLLEDDFVTDYITTCLRNRIKEVTTGRPAQIGSVSQKIKEKIDAADLAILILTRRDKKKDGTWTAPRWVIDEAIYAHGKGKKVIIVKEDGVEDLPGIFGDLEYIPLDRKKIASSIKLIDEMLADHLKSRKSSVRTRN